MNETACRAYDLRIHLHQPCLPDHPREPEEQHGAPDVEEAAHEHALDPAELDHLRFELNVGVCVCQTKASLSSFFFGGGGGVTKNSLKN